jgi:endonuclease V-like protein UPF0215 family
VDGLAEFLRARLIEREQALRALAEARHTGELPELARGPMLLIQAAPDGREQQALRELLADIEAKRRMIEALGIAERNVGEVRRTASDYGFVRVAESAHDALLYAVRLLALPYAEHADYRPEWAPDAAVGRG